MGSDGEALQSSSERQADSHMTGTQAKRLAACFDRFEVPTVEEGLLSVIK
jgi:hypothetical protein